ncbi:hypothetical protein RB195_000567 [Necator americanus]|uniref:t-SNARE coiled-coil homology domain-containing protein n=1 Tax=Necator americanus TaxID=51031 RepID=A0ABR1DB25_NECAM
MAYRGPSTSNNYDGSYLERHNDSLVDELSSKVAALKKVTISIGEDVREQNRLLNTMDDDFDSSKGLLASTMKRLGIVSKAGGKNVMCYLVLFALFVFFVIYYLASPFCCPDLSTYCPDIVDTKVLRSLGVQFTLDVKSRSEEWMDSVRAVDREDWAEPYSATTDADKR